MTQPRWGTITGGRTSRGRVFVPSLALTLAAGWSLAGASGAFADPAVVPAPATAAEGAYSAVAPDGACSVSATIQGGAGGSAIAIPGANGAGAKVSVTIPIVPGQKLSGVVGGSGGPSVNSADGTGKGGTNGGGDGGTSTGTGGIYHHGAGGGGYSTLLVEGQEVVVAGGGGGSGGGHAADAGFGGDAGLPTGTGVFAGKAGQNGRDTVAGNTVGGGGAGSTTGPGAGGTNASGGAQYSGQPGTDRTGGKGGNDPTPDAGGGGGGGYHPGGGGAATVGNGSGGVTNGGIGGGGGGGGASFIADLDPTGQGKGPTGISAENGPKAANAGEGADGTARLAWNPCDYDLAVAKDATPKSAPQGTDVTWTVTVKNNGPEPMTSGDLVTLVDDNTGAGRTTITSIETSGGTPSGLGDGAVTCDAGVGDALPATLTCGRAYDASGALGAPSGGRRGLNVGETLTVTYTQKAPTPGTISNTASVKDRATGDGDDSATSDVTVTPVTPVAHDDTTSGPQGVAQSRDVLANDEPGDSAVPLVPGTLTLLDGNGNAVSSVTVPGEGTYTIENGRVVFTPLPAFIGEATPVDYRVADTNGTTTKATYTPTFTPVAVPDTSTGPQGVKQTADVLANDATTGDVTLDPSTLTLIDPVTGDPVTTVTVASQGTYTVKDGKVVFTPEPSFTGVATAVRYQVDDEDGNTVESTYTPTVTPVTPGLHPDVTSGPQGVPQSVDPLVNDEAGDPQVPLDPSTLTLLDANGDETGTVTVPGQGVYTIKNGRIVFTPEKDFVGEATPVDYQVADTNGTTRTSTYTPTLTPVEPQADPDTTSGPQGRPQSVDPLVNDHAGNPDVPLDPSTLTLLDRNGDKADTVTIPGEGVYTVKDGRIVFTPEPRFTGKATPVDYRVADANGTTTTSTYTPTVDPVVPVAKPDVSSGPIGKPQSVDPFANDAPGVAEVPLDHDSLTLLDRGGKPVDRIEVPGEGVYTVKDGRIVFTPVRGFTGSATPVDYRIADVNGTTTRSTYTPTVLTPAVKDVGTIINKNKGIVGDPVTVDTVSQIPGLVPASVQLVGPDGPVTRLKVPGEGVWVVDPATGRVTFTPERGFKGDPTPVDIVGYLDDGTPITGKLAVDYTEPAAAHGHGPLAATGTPAMAVPLGIAGVVLVGAGLVLARRRRGQVRA